VKTKGRRIAIEAGLVAVVILGFTAWLTWPQIRFEPPRRDVLDGGNHRMGEGP
jgi:hypothetical protein